MSRKRYSPEKIIGMLREAGIVLAQGMTVGQSSRQLSISEQIYYPLAEPIWGHENKPGQADEGH